MASTLPVLPYRGKTPKIHEDAIVSPLATIIGDVEISEDSSVFPGAVIRGDIAGIRIGRCTNIQENVVIHGGDVYEGGSLKEHLPVEIGDCVTLAHGSAVHGSKIEDVSMIGISAIIFDASIVGEGSIVGLNSAVLENTRIPKRSLVVGIPAKVIKTVDDTTYSRLKKHALWYHQLAMSVKWAI